MKSAAVTYVARPAVEMNTAESKMPFPLLNLTFTRAIVEEIQMILTVASTALFSVMDAVAEQIRSLPKPLILPDPVLLVSFGRKPKVLVELSRWI